MLRFAVIRSVFSILLLSASATVLAQSGFVQVRAQPGIQVFLDDVFVGVTNADVGGLILTDVRPGARRLRFVREGFLPQDATVSVVAGQVLLYELGSLVPRVQVREEGAGGAAEMRVETGSVVVQCLPIECVVDIPALGITNRRKTQDRLVLEGVPVGVYAGRLSVGATTLPVSFGVCTDDTVSLFGTFVGSNQGVEVTSAAGFGPACERVSVRLVPSALSVLSGGRLPLRVELEGVGADEVVWSASAGVIEGAGAQVVLVAPDVSGEVRVRVASRSNPAWADEVVVPVASVVVERLVVEPSSVVAGDEVVVSWVITAAPALAGARFDCVLQAGGLADVPVADCGRVSSVAVRLPSAGSVPVRLRVAHGGEAVTVGAEVAVRRAPEPTSVRVTNVRLGSADAGARLVSFDVGWDESWRGPDRPSWVAASDNWDAAWVFVKYRVDGGAWQHATLASGGHVAPAGAVVDVPGDGMGAFVYRSARGYGTFAANGVGLAWDTVADGVPAGASVEVRPFAIEMVFVPQGSFSLGSGGSSTGEFRAGGTSNTPFVVNGQSSIALGDASGQLMWTASSYSGSPSGSTSASFPTGFGAFYLMKHQVTQGQYVNFLNTLTQAQADARKHTGSSDRYAITGSSVGSYASSLPFVALNYLSWADGAAFADWAGLRPLTELEFEKVARGPLSPVANEYAWGSTSIAPATGLSNAGTITETPTPATANAAYVSASGVRGPVRVGSFASPGRSRRDAGAGYYGALELSGNLWERPVTVGNGEGRAFVGTHGDGALDPQGNANVASWPGATAVGAGFRGGHWDRSDVDYLRVSYRDGAASANADRYSAFGWRGARSAP
jgi:formylglycine-generating enzyme required for sulfatase activity